METKNYELQNISIDEIKVDGRNPNVMNNKTFESLKKSISMWGTLVPVILNKDKVIVDGEHRWKAYKELGYKKAPCYVLDVNDIDRKILRQLLNKIKGVHKYELDKEEFSDILKEDERIIELIGESDINLQRFLKEASLENIEEDDVENPNEVNTTIERGDMYCLGEHRLMCGDSTDKNDVDFLLGENKIDLIVSDPPYNVNYSEKNKFLNSIAKGNLIQKQIENDDIEDFKKFIIQYLSYIKLSENNAFYLFISGKEISNVIVAVKEAGYYYSQDLKWIKNNHVLGRLDYLPKSENIIYGWKGKHKFYAGYKTDVLHYDKPVKSDLHPTMKPVKLISELNINSSLEKMNVYDGFGGSGTTLIACEQLKRKCFMMELDPVYCQVIINRWEKLTGKTATKAGERNKKLYEGEQNDKK